MAYYEGEISPIGTGYNNSGFGGGDGWWGIILLALLFGWGRGGAGFGGYGGSGVGDNYVLATDFATIERKLDGVNSGICDSTFALNNTITNGFAGVQQTLCQGFNGVNTAINQTAFNTERGLWNLSSQIANCCCETKSAIADLKYANERQTCDLITNQNANTQRIIDFLTTEKINSLTAENVALKGRISNANQTAEIVSALKPCPIPAYAVPNPNCCYSFCGNGTNTIL